MVSMSDSSKWPTLKRKTFNLVPNDEKAEKQN